MLPMLEKVVDVSASSVIVVESEVSSSNVFLVLHFIAQGISKNCQVFVVTASGSEKNYR